MLRRRAFLSLTALAALPARAQAGSDVLLVVLSDLHSANQRSAQVVAALDAELAAQRGTPAAVLVNGDVFERGNAVALRSLGAIDWAFMEALRRRAPVVLNLGNHEGALADDLRTTVAAAQARDILVLTNLSDAQGAPLATPAATLTLGGHAVRVVGIATDEALSYRAPVRSALRIPGAAGWARTHLPGLIDHGAFNVVLSHAGVVADRAILPMLPDATLLVGGHEHLRFAHEDGRTRYVHTGSWSRFFTTVALRRGQAPALASRAVAAADPTDRALAAIVAEVTAAHAQAAEREVVARLPAARDLGEAGRFLAAAMAAAAQADVAVVSHTTLGDGLPQGAVTRADLDAFIRFDGPLHRTRMNGRALARLLAAANQDAAIPLAERTGDFLYASPVLLTPERDYDVATIGWVRLNAARYLNDAGLAFAEIPDLRLRAVAVAALAR